jgi:hypothetical protein
VRYWTGAFVAFAFALVQASSVSQFLILGVSPNLVLVMLVSWLVVRGLDDVLPMVLVAGATMGLIGLQTPGLAVLALAVPITALGVLRELHVVNNGAILVVAFAAVATFVYETVLLAGVMAGGGLLDLSGAVRDAIVPAVMVNVALTPPVYVLMRLVGKPADRRHRLSF